LSSPIQLYWDLYNEVDEIANSLVSRITEKSRGIDRPAAWPPSVFALAGTSESGAWNVFLFPTVCADDSQMWSAPAYKNIAAPRRRLHGAHFPRRPQSGYARQEPIVTGMLLDFEYLRDQTRRHFPRWKRRPEF
jgi:hypothetical protein